MNIELRKTDIQCSMFDNYYLFNSNGSSSLKQNCDKYSQ